MEEEDEEEADFPIAEAPLCSLTAVSAKIAKKKIQAFTEDV